MGWFSDDSDQYSSYTQVLALPSDSMCLLMSFSGTAILILNPTKQSSRTSLSLVLRRTR